MKSRTVYIFAMCMALALPQAGRAQGTANDIETEYGGRFSVQLDYKLKKGLHLTADAELRLQDNFNTVGRYNAGLGVDYKINGFLKAGAGYTYISARNSQDEWNPRHRLYAELTGTLKSGDWRLSLKEKMQLTHRDEVNVYQTTPNALTLKSRLKAEYKGFTTVDPYIFVEARTVLNDPACSANWNGSAYSDYSFTGYNDVYFNRLRGAIGAEWKIDKHNSLDISAMLDYCYDKDIDTNKEGTKLKSLTYDRTIAPQLSIGYVYSF